MHHSRQFHHLFSILFCLLFVLLSLINKRHVMNLSIQCFLTLKSKKHWSWIFIYLKMHLFAFLWAHRLEKCNRSPHFRYIDVLSVWRVSYIVTFIRIYMKFFIFYHINWDENSGLLIYWRIVVQFWYLWTFA